MTHEEIEGLVPLLALDALSPPEELNVRTHVETCQGCAALLREHLETAADLALLAGPAAPSAGLKARLMAEVAKEERVVGDSHARPADKFRLIPSGRWRRTLAGLAAACLLLGAVNFVVARRLSHQNAVIAQQKTILELISGQPTMIMTPTDKGAGTTGHVFVKGGRAAVVLTGLDDSGKGVYELWAIRDGRPSPLKAVEKDDWQKEKGQAVVLVERGIQGVDGMAVSLEPSPPSGAGSAPRGPILLKT